MFFSGTSTEHTGQGTFFWVATLAVMMGEADEDGGGGDENFCTNGVKEGGENGVGFLFCVDLVGVVSDIDANFAALNVAGVATLTGVTVMCPLSLTNSARQGRICSTVILSTSASALFGLRSFSCVSS
jgi:hypothetical protein